MMFDLTVAEVLDAAADLITPPGKWMQLAYACDARGEPLFNGYDAAAVCWCGFGAIEKVTGQGMGGPLREQVTSAAGFTPSWNDAPERTQAEVVAKLREAAALAREHNA